MKNFGFCPCFWGDLGENPVWLMCKLSGKVMVLQGIAWKGKALCCLQTQKRGRRNKEGMIGKKVMRFKR